MKVEREDNQYGMVALVYPFDEDGGIRIRVERGREFGGPKWEPEARVHWSAFMPQGVDFARRYAAAISEACRIADEMNAVKEEELTTPDGYMVAYSNGEREVWVRIENGADVEMWDGWTVAKAQLRP